MFTEQQIKTAHSKVRSGADFPAYVQEIKQLGLVRYEYMVTDGTTVYYGGSGYQVNTASRYAPMAIAAKSSAAQLAHILSVHQQGQTDFMTFCRQAADAGVEKWEVNMQKMMCIYYDAAGNELVAEPIPGV